VNAALADAEALLPLAVAGVAGDADGVLVHGPGWHLRKGSGEPPVFDLSGPYAADPYSAQLGQYLRLLASGAIGPQEAADWATATMEEGVDFDDTTWQGLDRLAGADLLVGPDTPLHGPVDFAAWLREFEQGIAAS
jgi:hypothetical protein